MNYLVDGRVLAPVKTQLCLMVKDRGQRSRLQYKVRPFGETEEAEMLSPPDTLEFLLPGNFFSSWYVNAPPEEYTQRILHLTCKCSSVHIPRKFAQRRVLILFYKP